MSPVSPARRRARPRRYLVLTLALGLALAAPCSGASPDPELVLNPGFAPDGATAPAPIPGWTFYSWDGAAQAALDRAARPSGGAVVHLHGSAPGKAAIHQRVHLTPGRYRLSALAASWDLRPGRDNLSGRLLLELPGSRPAMLDLPKGDNDWTPVELVFAVTKETAGTLYCFLYGPGDLWLDEVHLTRLGPQDAGTPSAPPGAPPGAPPAAPSAAANREPLRFTPPPAPADLLLAGYCADPGQAERPHCRRLAAEIGRAHV